MTLSIGNDRSLVGNDWTKRWHSQININYLLTKTGTYSSDFLPTELLMVMAAASVM
jgi:hypothetical protein